MSEVTKCQKKTKCLLGKKDWGGIVGGGRRSFEEIFHNEEKMKT